MIRVEKIVKKVDREKSGSETAPKRAPLLKNGYDLPYDVIMEKSRKKLFRKKVQPHTDMMFLYRLLKFGREVGFHRGEGNSHRPCLIVLKHTQV